MIPSFPRSATGEAGSSPPLRLLLRQREGGGTLVLRLRCVVSRVWVSTGGALEVEVSPGRIRWPLLRPLCVVVLRNTGMEFAAFCVPRADAVATTSSALCGVLVLPPGRRRAAVFSGSGMGCVRWCVGVGLGSGSALLRLFGAEDGADSVVPQLFALPSCGSSVAEDDDFPSADFAVDVKVSPALEECGGGGGTARLCLASVVGESWVLRDLSVIFKFFEDCCTAGVC